MKKLYSMIHALYRVLRADNHLKKLPSLNLIQLHKMGSFQHIITNNTQIYYLATATVLYIFGKYLPPRMMMSVLSFGPKTYSATGPKRIFSIRVFLICFYSSTMTTTSFLVGTSSLIYLLIPLQSSVRLITLTWAFPTVPILNILLVSSIICFQRQGANPHLFPICFLTARQIMQWSESEFPPCFSPPSNRKDEQPRTITKKLH
jgi:hypothetical protein